MRSPNVLFALVLGVIPGLVSANPPFIFYPTDNYVQSTYAVREHGNFYEAGYVQVPLGCSELSDPYIRFEFNGSSSGGFGPFAYSSLWFYGVDNSGFVSFDYWAGVYREDQVLASDSQSWNVSGPFNYAGSSGFSPFPLSAVNTVPINTSSGDDRCEVEAILRVTVTPSCDLISAEPQFLLAGFETLQPEAELPPVEEHRHGDEHDPVSVGPVVA